jgi:hypothetical protein
MALIYLPQGFNINDYNFGVVPASAGFQPVTTFANIDKSEIYDWGFSDDPTDFNNFGGDDTTLLAAKEKATKKGDANWQRLINGALTYGIPVLKGLVDAGVIRNANFKYLQNGQFDRNALANLLGQTNGELAPSKLDQANSRGANIFGINTSTLLLVGAGLLVYSIFKKEPKTSKK